MATFITVNVQHAHPSADVCVRKGFVHEMGCLEARTPGELDSYIFRDTVEIGQVAKSCTYVPRPCTVARRVAALLSSMRVPC